MTPRQKALPVRSPRADGQPEQAFDKPLRLTAFDAMPGHRFVDLCERRDETGADALEDRVGVPVEHGMEHTQPHQHFALAIRLHRAEQLVRTLGESLDRRRIRRIDVAQPHLDDRRVDLVRRDILRGEVEESLAHPRHRALRGVHHLVNRDVEAQVGAIQRPRLLERVDVPDHEAQRRLVGARERKVVAAERMLREVAHHRAGLHAEQQGSEHRQHAGEHLHLVLLARFAELAWVERPRELLGRERLAKRRCQRFEHRAKCVEVQGRPVGSVQRALGSSERGGESRLGDDVGLRRERQLLELRAGGRVDRRFLGPFGRNDRSKLGRDLPVQGPRRLEHAHELVQIDVRQVEPGDAHVGKARNAHSWREARSSGRGPGRHERVLGALIGLVGLVVALRPARHAASLGTMVAIAVTGASGLVGTRLLSVLAGEPSVTRLVGLDVAEPERRARGLEFHRADVAHSELKPLLEGIDVLVHLATVVDPIPDERLMARVNVEGTRRVLDAAAAVGVNKVVRVSSAAVYGAWPNNPVPLTEDAPLRPNSAFSPAVQGAEVERLLAEWRDEHPGSIVTTLRTAPVLGPGAERLGSRLLLGRPPLRVRGAAPRSKRPTSTISCVRWRSSCSTTTRGRSTSRRTAGSTRSTPAPSRVARSSLRFPHSSWSESWRGHGRAGSARSRLASFLTSSTRSSLPTIDSWSSAGARSTRTKRPSSKALTSHRRLRRGGGLWSSQEARPSASRS